MSVSLLVVQRIADRKEGLSKEDRSSKEAQLVGREPMVMGSSIRVLCTLRRSLGLWSEWLRRACHWSYSKKCRNLRYRIERMCFT